MIGRAALEQRVREWGLREDIVEKDYVLGWVLWGIGSDPRLNTTWMFKGGTCLKKCYIETYRFSEDLDFTIAGDGPLLPEEVEPIFDTVLKGISERSGIDFSVRLPRFRARPSGRSTEGRIYYRGPRHAPSPASVKLDLTKDETVVRPTVLRPIAHPYEEQFQAPASVRCYSFDEVFAEKLRALGERCRPRDLYDVVNLLRRRDLQAQPQLIRTVLEEKCRLKGVPVPTFALLESSPYRTEIESEWKNMLGHQLPALPPFEQFWQELPLLFSWLNGTATLEMLPTIAGSADEDRGWSPPPTVWTWGLGLPLETVRFAGANHLCVELKYQGTVREVEPYSLRRTSDGNLLLHAIKTATREHRSYRVDRIQGITVTTHAFKPVYAVEFSQLGPLAVQPAGISKSTPSILGSTSGRRRSLGSGNTTYVVECMMCGRRFERSRHDTSLRPHKDKSGWPCYARSGYLVEVH